MYLTNLKKVMFLLWPTVFVYYSASVSEAINVYHVNSNEQWNLSATKKTLSRENIILNFVDDGKSGFRMKNECQYFS